MLVPSDRDYACIADRLERADFRYTPLSYGILDPDTINSTEEDPIFRRIHAEIARQYQMLDDHSTRFQFPLDLPAEFQSIKLVLLRGDYVEICLPPESQPLEGYTRDGIFYYPNAVVLLESFIRTLLKDEKESTWKLLLESWAISFICGYLDIPLDALGTCSSINVRS